MLLIDRENNSAVAISQLCGVKSRQTQSGKPLTIFSVIIGTHLDEFDNRVNDYQSCIAFASTAEYVDAVTQEQNRTKYLVAGTVRDNEYNEKTNYRRIHSSATASRSNLAEKETGRLRRRNQLLGERRMKTYLSWSGGKDSTASIILCHEKGIPLDGIIFCEVMFDNERNISGENPEHIDFIYNKAIPIIENRFGFSVTILRDKKDYLQEFNHIITKSKYKERIGRRVGFVVGGGCWANDRLKMRPIRQFNKQVGKHINIVGIAIDEPERLSRLNQNCRSVLAEYGITETQTYNICRKHDLLSPIYEHTSRGGCWFCPNSSIRDFARLAKEYPELWAELEKLSHTENLVSQGFKYGRTFESVNKEVQAINNQMNLFDMGYIS